MPQIGKTYGIAFLGEYFNSGMLHPNYLQTPPPPIKTCRQILLTPFFRQKIGRREIRIGHFGLSLSNCFARCNKDYQLEGEYTTPEKAKLTHMIELDTGEKRTRSTKM